MDVRRVPAQRRSIAAPARVRRLAGVMAVALIAAACGIGPGPQSAAPSHTPGVLFPSAAAPASGSAIGSPAPAASAGGAASSAGTVGQLASSGAIALIGGDGSLSIVDAQGGSTVLSSADSSGAFPAWSPDGKHIAAVVGSATDRSLVVFDAPGGAGDAATQPVTIFTSSTIAPFYLSWRPDGRQVSFLAQDPEQLALRVAAADGSSALDGSDPATVVRIGNPLYYDWVASDQLLAHVGVGADSFLGEIGLDGDQKARPLPGPADFRSAVVSDDGRYVAYVRTATSGDTAVVVGARDGSDQQRMAVVGQAALEFDPRGDTLGAIGSIDPGDSAFAIPVGPLRLIDAQSGKIRTLVDGAVVGFWWSPDGKTIAALRLQQAGGPSPSGSEEPVVPVAATPSEAPATEIRLLFVDVASGTVRSDPVVSPAQLFVSQLLTYFDQYALSHQLWAPDGSSFLMPVVDPDGMTRVAVMDPDRGRVVALDGSIGFWSPPAGR